MSTSLSLSTFRSILLPLATASDSSQIMIPAPFWSASSMPVIQVHGRDDVSLEMNAFNLRIEESSPAAFADLVLLDFGTIGLEAQAYSVARDVIAAYVDWASVVHANANEVQLGRGDRVVSDMAVGRAGGDAPICRTVSKDVLAHESIVGTDDSNVRAGETHDLKTANVRNIRSGWFEPFVGTRYEDLVAWAGMAEAEHLSDRMHKATARRQEDN
ncbi:hypothetical protein KCU79_g9, partial [Aureobasidium melanogenum]